MPRADWPAPAPLRADWSALARPRAAIMHLLPALFFIVLVGFPVASAEWSSSERSPPSAPYDAELVRDAPLYPPLQHETEPYDQDIETIFPETKPALYKFEPYGNTIQTKQETDFDLDLENDPYDVDLELISKTSFDTQLDSHETAYNDLESNLEESKTSLNEFDNESYDVNFQDNFEQTQPWSNPQKDFHKNISHGKDLKSTIDQNIYIHNTKDQTILYNNDKKSILDEKPAEEAGNLETDNETNVQRQKRSSGKEWDKAAKTTDNRRVKTGDTILNIRGAVRDAIGDAGAAPGPRASSRLDTFVIRGAAGRSKPNHAPYKPPPRDQVPRHARELLVEAHSRARIPCDLHNITGLRWYKDNEQLNLPSTSSGEAIWREGSSAVVGRATRGDAGAWRCAGNDRTGKTITGEPIYLLIYEPVRSVYLAVDGRRLDAGNTWVPVRDKTELEVRCVAEGGVPPPELSWRLLALEPTLDHRPYLRIHQTNYSIEGVSTSNAVVTAARELHNATLQCEAKQRRPAPLSVTTSASPADQDSYDVLTAKLEIHVTYPPSFVISRWPGFGVSLAAGSAAALRCDVDANPPARAWWLRDDDNPTSSPPPLETGMESRGSATLRWAALRSAHAGWYRCRASWLDAEYSSIGYYLNVISAEDQTEPATEASTAEEEDIEPEHQKVDVPVGGNVQLHCPKGSVGCWWRKVVGNSSESWAPAGSHHAHGVLGIKDAVYQEGGEYRCVGARGAGRDAARLRELKRVTVRVSGGATAAALSAQPARDENGGGWRLECGACGRGVRVVWIRARRPPEPAHLAPDLAQHCWRAVLHVHDPDEVWCVAATPGGGAVAVFPPRAPHPSPAPARHTVRAPYNAATRRDAATTRHVAATILLCVTVTMYVLGAK